MSEKGKKKEWLEKCRRRLGKGEKKTEGKGAWRHTTQEAKG